MSNSKIDEIRLEIDRRTRERNAIPKDTAENKLLRNSKTSGISLMRARLRKFLAAAESLEAMGCRYAPTYGIYISACGKFFQQSAKPLAIDKCGRVSSIILGGSVSPVLVLEDAWPDWQQHPEATETHTLFLQRYRAPMDRRSKERYRNVTRKRPQKVSQQEQLPPDPDEIEKAKKALRRRKIALLQAKRADLYRSR